MKLGLTSHAPSSVGPFSKGAQELSQECAFTGMSVKIKMEPGCGEGATHEFRDLERKGSVGHAGAPARRAYGSQRARPYRVDALRAW
jgi:hypothetical protein